MEDSLIKVYDGSLAGEERLGYTMRMSYISQSQASSTSSKPSEARESNCPRRYGSQQLPCPFRSSSRASKMALRPYGTLHRRRKWNTSDNEQNQCSWGLPLPLNQRNHPDPLRHHGRPPRANLRDSSTTITTPGEQERHHLRRPHKTASKLRLRQDVQSVDGHAARGRSSGPGARHPLHRDKR
jgi:hypothetical protein